MIAGLIFLAAWLAFTISAVAGGGAGLVMVPLLRLIVPIETVPAALSIGTAASAVSRIALFRREIRWDVVRRFVPPALCASAAGAWLLTRFEPAYVELLIALFLLVNLPGLLRPRRVEQPTRKIGPAGLTIIGAVAGLLSGFTGAVGLLFNGVYRRLGLTPREIVATRATNEVLLHLVKIMLYAAFGLLGRATVIAGALVAVAAVLATVTTRWLLPRLHEAAFRRIGQAAMAAAGIAMFCLSSGQLLRLHRAWIDYAAPGDARELRVFWQGRQHIAFEAEAGSWPEIERTVPFEALPEPIRRRAAGALAGAEIVQVETVHGVNGLGYEIYYRRGNASGKIEFD